MKLFDVKEMTAIERLFLLRSIAIATQFTAVLAVYFVMSLQISIYPLLLVIAVETVFHLLSMLVYRDRKATHAGIMVQLLADVLFLTLLMSQSGGATNAFVSLLLMPIVIAAVSLPARLLGLISLAAVLAYSALLLQMPSSSMHQMDMSNHYIGMWANFLLSVIVVTFVVGAMARMITKRERALALGREQQLRNEQLLALGVASAQVTHQLATPLANLQLLFDELIEDYPKSEAVQAMRQPLLQCADQLGYFRGLACSIRTNQPELITASELLAQFQQAVQLNFPQLQFDTDTAALHSPINLGINDEFSTEILIQGDAMLLPALLNLIQNSVKASEQGRAQQVILSATCQNNSLVLSLRDFGSGIKQPDSLGAKLVQSDTGLGMAVLLSNSTFERLGGSLTLSNHPQQGAIACVRLPIIENLS